MLLKISLLYLPGLLYPRRNIYPVKMFLDILEQSIGLVVKKEVLKLLAELPDIKYYVAGVIEEGYVDVLETFSKLEECGFW